MADNARAAGRLGRNAGRPEGIGWLVDDARPTYERKEEEEEEKIKKKKKKKTRLHMHVRCGSISSDGDDAFEWLPRCV